MVPSSTTVFNPSFTQLTGNTTILGLNNGVSPCNAGAETALIKMLRNQGKGKKDAANAPKGKQNKNY